MPTYDYRCSGCGHAWERFEPMAASRPKACPKCRRRKGRRQISGGGGLIFRGPGFYLTDYRKDKSPKRPD
jgi:putative FmdB family regulatory protein